MRASRTESHMTGSCLCGGVAFELDGPGTAIELCHCSRCRKASGSAFIATFYVHASDFRWTRGEALIRQFDAPIREKPPAYRHVFCATCGSSLPIEKFGVVEIPASTVDGDPGSRPLRHIYTRVKATWFDIRDELPQYDAHVPRSEHLVVVSRILDMDLHPCTQLAHMFVEGGLEPALAQSATLQPMWCERPHSLQQSAGLKIGRAEHL